MLARHIDVKVGSCYCGGLLESPTRISRGVAGKVLKLSIVFPWTTTLPRAKDCDPGGCFPGYGFQNRCQVGKQEVERGLAASLGVNHFI